MIVSIGLLTLRLIGPQTLKTKRGMIRSLQNRVHNRFNLSVSEVDGLNDKARGTIALANTGNSVEYSTGVLQDAIRFIEREIVGKAELVEIQTDVISPF